MKVLHKKIIAVGISCMVISGGFAASIVNANAYQYSKEDYEELLLEVSNERKEDLKSILHLSSGKFMVLEADPSEYYLNRLYEKCKFKKVSIGNNRLIKALRDGEDISKLGLNKGGYYFVNIPDDSRLNVEVDGLQILIYVN